MVAPAEISAAYSAVEMQATLAVTPDTRCVDDECIAAQAFRTQVQHVAERVSDGAYRLAFESNLPAPSFLVTVPGKDDIGTLSSAAGSIVVFDGLRSLQPQEALLAFLIAREMGHVLARHHEENSATSIGISIAVSLLFPMANILRGAEAAYATAATTASLASTAVSMAGSRIVRGIYRAEQQREADIYALTILAHAGWTAFEVAEALQATMPLIIGEGWMAELRESKRWLDQVAVGPPLPPAPIPAVLPAPVEPEPMTVGQFSALLDVGGDSHEQAWGAVWRQGEWRGDLACKPLAPADTVVRRAIVRVAKPCAARGKQLAASCVKKKTAVAGKTRKSAVRLQNLRRKPPRQSPSR